MSNKNQGLSSFGLFLIWFGAAISIAEILTGGLLAPLGFTKGIGAILIGHFIGAAILFLAGYIGAREKLTSMEATRISFGKYGSYVFSVLNIFQLVLWAAIMIQNGAKLFDQAMVSLFDFSNPVFWCIAIGISIGVWILVGLNNLAKINIVVISLLFVFSILLFALIFTKEGQPIAFMEQRMTFSQGVELNVAMCLSWLPLISDYTRSAKNTARGPLASVLGYFLASSFMFALGLKAVLAFGDTDLSSILIATGLGIPGLFIVFFSTITTTFLDVFSAGVSANNLNGKWKETTIAFLVCLLAILLAILIPLNSFEPFLYFIGSVFSPLYAVLFTDYFILNRKAVRQKGGDLINTLLWLTGVILYRAMLNLNSLVGTTFVVIGITGILCVFTRKGEKIWNARKKK
jgi:putative hydroxymethylpyrimidine transporter CytX